MVRSYKSSVALRIHRMRGAPSGPIWQRNYYEHIIRSEAEWQRIRDYIQANPSSWETDDDWVIALGHSDAINQLFHRFTSLCPYPTNRKFNPPCLAGARQLDFSTKFLIQSAVPLL